MNSRFLKRQRDGFSLLEILITFAILIFFFLGVIAFFAQITIASQAARDSLMALVEAQTKLEEIRNYPFDDIAGDYAVNGTPGASFVMTEISGGMGWIYVDTTDPDMYIVEIYMHWSDRFGRVVGEDVNLNGVLDGGEDANGNGKLDSTVSLEALLTRKI